MASRQVGPERPLMNASEFNGKTVLLTGAGGGLGQAITAEFRSRGAHVIGCDRQADGLGLFAEDDRRVFDLSDRAASAALARELVAAGQVPDILVNNAGWTRADSLTTLSPDEAGLEIDLNLTGVVAFTLPIAAAMALRGHGSIVFVSSVNALMHLGNPAYSAAKAGINGFARAVAVEYGHRGVRANTVCPGSIRTPAWDHRIERDPSIPAKLRGHYPLGRIVEPVEVARAIAFLASDLASGITGATLPVDAGLTAGNSAFIRDILGG